MIVGAEAGARLEDKPNLVKYDSSLNKTMKNAYDGKKETSFKPPASRLPWIAFYLRGSIKAVGISINTTIDLNDCIIQAGSNDYIEDYTNYPDIPNEVQLKNPVMERKIKKERNGFQTAVFQHPVPARIISIEYEPKAKGKYVFEVYETVVLAEKVTFSYSFSKFRSHFLFPMHLKSPKKEKAVFPDNLSFLAI